MVRVQEVELLFRQLGIEPDGEFKGLCRKDGNPAFRFRKSSYFYEVRGHVPLTIAKELYEHPLHPQIRVEGNLGSPPPDQTGPNQYYTWVKIDPALSGPRSQYIGLYHIDTAEALAVFAETLKRHGLVDTPRLIRWKLPLAELFRLMLTEGRLTERTAGLPPVCESLADISILESLAWRAEHMLIYPGESGLNGPAETLMLSLTIEGKGDDERPVLEIFGSAVDDYPVVPTLRKLIAEAGMAPAAEKSE